VYPICASASQAFTERAPPAQTTAGFGTSGFVAL